MGHVPQGDIETLAHLLLASPPPGGEKASSHSYYCHELYYHNQGNRANASECEPNKTFLFINSLTNHNRK